MKRSIARLTRADVFSRQLRPRILVLSLIFLLISGVVASHIKRPGGSPVFASAVSGVETLATMGESVTVHAVGRGKPYINFSDGNDVLTEYSAASTGTGALQSPESPLAMASADFDEDGVPDLVSGYSASGGGILILHRGNVDSIYPNAPEAQQRRATGVFTDAPFLSPATVFDLPLAADFVGAGDFDADGHWDVVTASRGNNALYFSGGDGKGHFRSAEQIELPGRVTAMATGEVNRADGLIDVVVGVATASGARALVFESPEGALRGKAESFDLRDEATAIAIGNLDAEYTREIAVAAGRELMVISGRDRKLSLDEKQRATVPKARTSRRAFSFGLKSLAIGDFKGDHNAGLAVLTDQDSVHLLSAVSAKAKKKGIKKWKDEAWASGSWAQATQMVRARVSSVPSDDLVIVDGPGHKVHIVAKAAASQQQQAQSVQSVSFDVEDEPMAVMPMRLNSDALSDLVILRNGQAGPTAVTSQPALIFTVTTDQDNVAGSLRAAIDQANTNPGLDTINFAIGTGPQTITPIPSLPTITDAVVIDGTTQPGFAGAPIIELDGSIAGMNVIGLFLSAGNSTVRGLVINRFDANGIAMDIGGNNIVEGNFIGTGFTGNAVSANGGHGVVVFAPGTGNTIGGTAVQSRNVISGNDLDGVAIQANANLVQGNFIGTDASGLGALGNTFDGVFILGAPDNTIGGAAAGARNVISGNSGNGISIEDSGATGNLVQGNFIGTDSSANAALGGSGFAGVSLGVASANTIGGTSAAARNVISGNGTEGVNIQGPGNTVQGNFIGTDFTGTSPVGNLNFGVFIGSDTNDNMIEGNTIAFNSVGPFPSEAGVFVQSGANNAILSNSIFSNEGLGIDLQSIGVTPNDPCDSDAEANNLQNFPVLTSAPTTSIQGTLNSTATTTFTIQFFSNTSCDPSGNGEGQSFIGQTSVTTDGSCNATINFPVSLSSGQVITATATDPAGNTSEFSACVAVSAPSCTITCPPNQTVNTGPSSTECGAVVNYPPPTTTGSCGSFVCAPASGTFFPVGTTTVTCRVSAPGPTFTEVGNCTFTVTVVDNTPPKVICSGDVMTSTDPNQTSAVVDYVTNPLADNCPLSQAPVCLPPSGTRFPLGTTTVTCTGKDTAGNTASCSFVVTVQDTQAPTITCPPNVLAVSAQGQTSTIVNYPAPAVAGNPGDVAVACMPPPGSAFPLGTTVVNCTATDTANNRSSCSFTVTVNQGNPSLDKTAVDFGNPIALPNQNPPTDTFTITNASAASVDLTLASIRRTGSDVGGRITNPDDSGFFTVFAINPGGADTQLSLGSTITIPAGQRSFRVMFNPSIPSVASGTSNLSASQVLPDVVTSSVNFNVSGGGLLTVNLTGRVATGLRLIDPANATRSPVVTFSRSGNQFNLTYSVFDSNLDVSRASYQFLDSGGQPNGQPLEVNLAQALQAVNLVRGQSFTVDQPFTGASSHPEIAGVRVTIFDGETSVLATATLGSSAASSAPAGDGQRMTVVLPRLRIKRFTS